MRIAPSRWGRLGLLTLPLLAGCASAYHSYSGACVPCRYYAPPPLLYTPYGECVCHSSAATPYLGASAQPVEPTTDGVNSDEAVE